MQLPWTPKERVTHTEDGEMSQEILQVYLRHSRSDNIIIWLNLKEDNKCILSEAVRYMKDYCEWLHEHRPVGEIEGDKTHCFKSL